MGLTERHWFEDEEPELTERQLEDAVREQKDAYKRGYQKGYSDRDKEIVRCKNCKHNMSSPHNPVCELDVYRSGGADWFCADGEHK